MVTPQTNESPNFLILVLMVLLIKLFFDFYSMDGNYPLLVKLLYMIILISAMVIMLHPEEIKKAVKQTILHDYLKKKFK